MGATKIVREVLSVYVLVCVGAFAVTRLEGSAALGGYTSLLIAALFLVVAFRMTRGQSRRFGLELGGLLEPAPEDAPGRPGPFGLFDLGRAFRDALPSALRETSFAILIALLTFPPFALGFWWWHQPTHAFTLAWPPELGTLVLAQLVMVALPEEALFRGYTLTRLQDAETRRVRLLGAEFGPGALVGQSLLFALIHFVVDLHPARLAVFFPGLLFGWMRVRRGGIGAAMVFHALCNLYSEVLTRSWL